MPHSSGGGSHSGGSHSGSSHSSHSSRSSGGGRSGSSGGRRTSAAPFTGSKRYLYYSNHQPRFVYANYDIRKKNTGILVTGIIAYSFLILPFLFSIFWVMITSVNIPKKLDYFEKNGRHPEYVIEDNLGVIEDKKSLKKSMKAFYEETGIVPAVITVSNDEWKQDYSSLEKYAYKVYVKRFDDEAHWLIIYSESVKDNGFVDWYWEGMQGDDTDHIITENRADDFTGSLNDRLLQRDKYSVDEAITATFDEYRPQMMKISLNTPMFIAFLCMFLLTSGLSVPYFFSVFKRSKVPADYKNAVPCDLTTVYQASCGFCGGVYIIGMHTECPHCGANIPSSYYVKDDQGNTVTIPG